MAITSTITDRLPDSQKPTAAHVPTAVTELTGTKFSARFSITVAATGNVDADEETAYDNIEAAAKTALDAWLQSTVKLDPTDTITAVHYIETLAIQSSDKWSDASKDYALTGRTEWQ